MRSPNGVAGTVDQVQKEMAVFYAGRLKSDGLPVHVPGFSRADVERGAIRRVEWAKQSAQEFDDFVSGSGVTAKVSDLTKHIEQKAAPGTWSVADDSLKHAKMVSKGLRNIAKREYGSADATLTGSDLAKFHASLISDAAKKEGAEQASLVATADYVESFIKDKLGAEAGEEFSNKLLQKRVSRDLAEGAKNQITSMGKAGGDSAVEAGQNYGLAMLTGVFHPLAAGARKLKAVAEVVGQLGREHKIKHNAIRYYQGQAVFNEVADSATYAAFTRAGQLGKKFALGAFDYHGATGGIVSNVTGRAITTSSAMALRKSFYGMSEDDDGDPHARQGVSTLNDNFQRSRDMVLTTAGDMMPLIEQMQAKVGTSDEHPQLTMETAAGVVNVMGYLSTAVPKAQ